MNSFKKTASQTLAVQEIVASSAHNFCLEGGSRSGKSVIIMRSIIVRAAKEAMSDHIICRETFNAAKRSIWQKTMPDVFRMFFAELKPKYNRSDYYVQLSNGSRIFIAGLDDKEKLERLLGTE